MRAAWRPWWGSVGLLGSSINWDHQLSSALFKLQMGGGRPSRERESLFLKRKGGGGLPLHERVGPSQGKGKKEKLQPIRLDRLPL